MRYPSFNFGHTVHAGRVPKTKIVGASPLQLDTARACRDCGQTGVYVLRRCRGCARAVLYRERASRAQGGQHE